METPILKNREWRYLLRDLVNSHSWLRPIPNDALRLALAPAASLAWWIARSMHDLADRETLTVLLPGAGMLEFADEGRWFAFLPWLLGQPRLETRVILVGQDLRPIRQEIAGATRPHIARIKPCDSFAGTVGQWRSAAGKDVCVDGCALFGPTFADHHRALLSEDGILPLLRNGLSVAVFSDSELEALEDRAVLERLEVVIESPGAALNPWRLMPEPSDGARGFAHSAWALQATAVPDQIDPDASALGAFLDLRAYGRVDVEAYGGIDALASLGTKWPVPATSGAPADALIALPRNHAIRESTGEVGYFHPDGFSLFSDPRLVVPAEKLAARPADDDVVNRICWALDLQRNWIAPRLEKTFSAAAGRNTLDDALLAAVSKIDPEAIRYKRAEAGERRPTHPHWAILFRFIGWHIDRYEPVPARLHAAFFTPSAQHARELPVFCEAYGYVPGEDDDEAANEAMATIASTYPDGALLVFNLMPYNEVEGDRYQFGGMLFWRGGWHAFALNRRTRSVDDVIAQVEGGFTFADVDRKYADNKCQLAIPFNQMCRGISPDARPKSVKLERKPWVWVLPDTREDMSGSDDLAADSRPADSK